MEVNIIFQNESKVDENNSFDVEFKNEQEIIEVFFNQKRDYYLTNAIAFIENKVNYSKDIKDLKTIAKKHLDEEKKEVYSTPMPNTGGISYNFAAAKYNHLMIRAYTYLLNKKRMHLNKKTYKYLNTETNKVEDFRVYDYLQHLREGITYNKDPTSHKNATNGSTDLYNAVNFKLMNNDKTIRMEFIPSLDQSFRTYTYEWLNTIFMKEGNVRAKSDSGWVFRAHKIILEMKKAKKAQHEINTAVGRWIARYLLGKEKALVFIHLLNYRKLTDSEKRFVFIVFNSDGTCRINHVNDYYIYVPSYSNYHARRPYNILTAYPHYGYVERERGTGDGLRKFTNMPSKFLQVYKINKIISMFNFTANHYQILDDLNVFKYFYEWPNTGHWIKSFAFNGEILQKQISDREIKVIKNFNNYDKKVKDANLNDLIKAAEYAYFLYENQNIITETFISEINKKVNLIGSISYFGNTEDNGKINLINNKNKLNFKVKKSQNLSRLSFNLSPTVASEKINFKKSK